MMANALRNEYSQRANEKKKSHPEKDHFLTNAITKELTSDDFAFFLFLLPLGTNFDFIFLTGYICNYQSINCNLKVNIRNLIQNTTKKIIFYLMLQHFPVFIKHLFYITAVCSFSHLHS